MALADVCRAEKREIESIHSNPSGATLIIAIHGGLGANVSRLWPPGGRAACGSMH